MSDEASRIDPSLKLFGDNLIALGMAFKDPETSISELAEAAHKCGLRLEFRMQSAAEQEAS